MDFSDITLDYETVDVDMNALLRLAEQGAAEYSSTPVEPSVTANAEAHAIDVTMGTPGYTISADDLYALAEAAVDSESYGTVTLDMAEVDPTDVDITAAYGELASEPTEPYYSGGTVHEGTYGYSLDWDSAVAEILAASWGDTLEIPMTPVAPERTAADIQAVLFRDQLSSYSSPHTVNANRTTNLTLACKAINGTVLNPGETFSFNAVVGERTAAKGYKEATVYVGTESVGELGGGICQVASTIYDAVLYADLEVTVRAPHIFYVTYVPGGLDATVYWGSQDFCFRNDTDYPIRINASVSGGYVNISIDGTKTNNNYVKLSYNKLSTVPYSTVTKYDSSLPSGTSKETTSPYTGYTFEAYQYVYDGNGNLLETNYLGKSTYQKRDQVITVGTG
jgi:vancomycin resistance protein YoaR